MGKDTLYKVAIEFGYREKIVRCTLDKKDFDSAGELVEYLEDHATELENEVEEKAAREMEKKKEEDMKTTHSLRAETEALYKSSICLACWKNKRSFVTLPCCHFSLCASCGRSTNQCPLRDCKEKIMDVIQTFV